MIFISLSAILHERKHPIKLGDDEPETDIPFTPEDTGDVLIYPDEGSDNENNNKICVPQKYLQNIYRQHRTILFQNH